MCVNKKHTVPSVCVYTQEVAMLLSPLRRAAARRRDIARPSRSDAVKVRHFTATADDRRDCSFATLTFPLQCTINQCSPTDLGAAVNMACQYRCNIGQRYSRTVITEHCTRKHGR